MSYEELKTAVEGYTNRSGDIRTPNARPGLFNLLTLPISPLEATDNERVHFVDVINAHAGPIDMHALQNAYKQAYKDKDFTLIPAPFGFKVPPPEGSKLQLNVCKIGDSWPLLGRLLGSFAE
jgi:hypothetical protein